MYDAYDLARRAADMLRQFVDLPKLDDPAALSFFIAKNTPLQDSTRQELLEVDEGAISTLVNPGGYVHEPLTLSRAWGLMLRGHPDTRSQLVPRLSLEYCSLQPV
ncbi:hypothetical protein R1sor_022714 [Riccia sorocarpa]|uniref:Uncharacterized protein n=1 Tax=Riccia sorocarpa TaxID=122646 RepID=A0ABD3GKP5_9MARC